MKDEAKKGIYKAITQCKTLKREVNFIKLYIRMFYVVIIIVNVDC